MAIDARHLCDDYAATRRWHRRALTRRNSFRHTNFIPDISILDESAGLRHYLGDSDEGSSCDEGSSQRVSIAPSGFKHHSQTV
jgi:hypothetical protein